MDKRMVTGTLEGITDNSVTIDGKNYMVKDKKTIDALSDSVAQQVTVVVEYTEDDVYVVDVKHP